MIELLAQAGFFSSSLGLMSLAVIGVIGLIVIIILFKYGLLYIQATLSGAHVGLLELVGMSLRKVAPMTIVNARVMSVKAGIPVDTNKLEAHYLAKGNVVRVVTSLIASNKAKIVLTFEQAAAIDLAGRDVLDAVQTSVRPKVIDCPDPKKGRETLDAVAKDGIQLKVKARVTVRTNLERLVGGATEETIIARVGEGIVSSIGSAESYKVVLENPDRISKGVLDKGLDSQTAFEIVSIDIADVDVGDNVGARLRVDQAEADKKMAQAEAEKRRALAVAREQEMVALDKENRAKVTLAEAEIPAAMAEAFRQGRMGIMDYYGMRNVQADTDMRRSIADPREGSEPKSH
ncbi:MAG TPA: flotillin-like protein FloA [Planctomycetota bacterium]|nr:flotillin-like protein FloA [Planctomycetota bacterium]